MSSLLLTFVISGNEAEVVERIGAAIGDSGRARVLATSHQPVQTPAEIRRFHPAAAVVVLGEEQGTGLNLIRELAIANPGTMLIAASADASPDLILSSLRAGAREFLRLPLIAEDLAAVLERTAGFAARHAAIPKKRGRVIAVFSNKGGCGVSFTATNLALALDAPTALVDLNLQGGDLGFFLHIEPKFSIANLVENWARVDEKMLDSVLTPHSPNLVLLSAPSEIDAAVGVSADHILGTLELLRERYDYIVLDLGHTFDEVTLTALDQADEILLVLMLDLLTVRNAQRVLSTFNGLDYPRQKVRVVINRWSEKDSEIKRPQIGRIFAGREINFVPQDYRTVVNTINLGQPIVKSKPSSPVSVALRNLAAVLAGSQEKKEAAKMDDLTETTHSNEATVNGQSNGHSNGHIHSHLKGHSNEFELEEAKTWKSQIFSLFRSN